MKPGTDRKDKCRTHNLKNKICNLKNIYAKTLTKFKILQSPCNKIEKIDNKIYFENENINVNEMQNEIEVNSLDAFNKSEIFQNDCAIEINSDINKDDIRLDDSNRDTNDSFKENSCNKSEYSEKKTDRNIEIEIK